MISPAIVGVSPFETPDVGLVETLGKAGALAVLDLGRTSETGRNALAALHKNRMPSYGVRISRLESFTPMDLSDQVTTLILDATDLLHQKNPASTLTAWQQPQRKIWVQVCSFKEAKALLEVASPDGLIAKGAESGGRVGSTSSLILMQELRTLDLPFWVQGGIGLHAAAAAFAAGASAVVLDSQLALLKECQVSDELKKIIRHFEGTETKIIHQHQVVSRPDLKVPQEHEIERSEFLSSLGLHLRQPILPAGQDLCLARVFADRFMNAAAMVQGLKRSIRGHLRQAKALAFLQSDGPLAQAYGTRYPIAQGPMTRVSDRSEFIKAVADNGALPFVALSLMGKKACRELLEETERKLGSQPWGVGILGFVSEELRQEQLEALKDFRPSAVLIAGGRPAQADFFEQKGIRSFLHVPSPGLLQQFLKDGARRFVFEGRECGGHVGPRYSFVLWETQIEILLQSNCVDELEVFFAGGLHDAVSGAMLAAMTAPLAARGAKIGALIGSAYLFTHEAVASGAILQKFQDEAVRCKETSLLETAPGHAVRCADTRFVHTFNTYKNELRGRKDPKQVWAELEELNVGRLRIASKGLERQGDRLVTVDPVRQGDEGLYMLGQVAQLRHEVCSMHELHEDIANGATRRIAALSVDEAPKRQPVDIAIIGMACIFPGAKDVESYWRNILSGADLISEVPEDRWKASTYYDPKGQDTNKSISKWGGFIDETEFDPLEFGIPPNSMGAIEPTQLLSLKVAKRALEDAGYQNRTFDRERTSVIFGAEAGTDLSSAYGFRAQFPMFAGPIPPELDAHLPSLTEDSFPGVLANVISGRIANRLDLGGSNYTVDAACASSLAALDLAIKELTEGESEMVLCGGADLHNSINDYLMFSSVKALSSTGKSHPFSSDGDGIVIAEGVAVIVLKRLPDAIRDGDRIYSVVKAIGSSSDGKSLGLTAPRKEGQMRALNRAYERAGLNPTDIELVEAHGTGTVVGDRTELETLSTVFFEAGALNRQCALGSVKSQIGHTKCAAGLAGVIKTSLALYHGIVPPTLHVQEPNPYYRPSANPFYFSSVAIPWVRKERKAAVSAFGFGGTNFHTILTSYSGPDRALPASQGRTAELFMFANQEQMRQLQEILQNHPELHFSKLAYTQAQICGNHVTYTIVAQKTQDLLQKIEQALSTGESIPAQGIFVRKKEAFSGKIAFLFSGQGSQSLNMGAEIFNSFPHLRTYLELGATWLPKIFPKGIVPQSEEQLKKTTCAQPALGLVEMAFHDLLQRMGLKADMLAGHSYGELTALYASGSINAEQLIQLSQARAQAIETAAAGQKGSMAAVSADYAAVSQAIQGLDVFIANHNAPQQVVIAGLDAPIDAALISLKAQGLAAKKIPVACAFHTPLLAEAEALFALSLAQVPMKAPQKPIYANSTAEPHALATLREGYAKQIVRPVQFVGQIETMHADGARLFLEVGPGSVLKDLVGRILGDRPHLARSMGQKGNSLEQFLKLVADLLSLGLPLQTDILFEDRHLQAYDFELWRQKKTSPTLWLVNGHLARPRVGVIPKGALKPGEFQLNLSRMTQGADMNYEYAKTETRESLVKEYLQSMRQLVESQKQVMLQYLGADQQPTLRAVEAAPVREAQPVLKVVAAPVVETKVEPTVRDIKQTVLQVVSQKTGYPSDMLDLDQDLEADLSIDSIKRFEIIADLGDILGHGRDQLEKLASMKTLRQMIGALESQQKPAAPAAVVTTVTAAPVAAPPPEIKADQNVRQYLIRVEEAPLNIQVEQAKSLEGRRIAVLQDSKGIAQPLAGFLSEAGALVTLVSVGEEAPSDTEAFDGLVLLSLLDEWGSNPTEVFKTLQQACRRNVHTIIGVTGRGGAFGHEDQAEQFHQGKGMSGLFKSLAKEYADKLVKVIDFDPREQPALIARQIFQELLAGDPLVEVGYLGDVRRHLVCVPLLTELGQEMLSLDKNSVILMLGGARGIAAQVAVKLAEQYGCRFEIVGRSPLPDEESAETAGIKDLQGLKAHFVVSKTFKKPAEIEAACRRIMQNREMQATVQKLKSLGSGLRYHCFDVRDKGCLETLIDRLYTEGRIDGVIHAAGVLSDSLILDKTPEAFKRVFETKVNPAEVLEAKLQSDVKFVALFSSVSGCFGNRGQTDYAAANCALDHVARSLGRKVKGRTLSINWGPWAGTGMVTTDLENEYRRRGIGLIPPQVGTQRFLDELRFGRHDTRQVVIMNGSPESFGFS
ncbi:MAG TPA: SDR family NAD(P)-dependent oxidoreductase [Oligoflexus sp.]|uniref:SDR family NAD(P)-dependent oxidoreductase n=1 Tax=Oligoflexus sp. TaxID=1971216 RepID=UPI002D3CA060|nr:SDR family NAD(P)-dependent oxidoreductase [Oligoflexus sp.]HYX38566.1 SDR family NAD(P)-dependent oxidoreductase [Oligoflexus sp.]